MAKYIEKEVAVKIAEKYGLTDGSVLGRHSGIADCIASEIATLPIADVVPVRHGRWVCIRKGYGEYKCSVCHGMDSNCSDYYGTHVVTEQEYCPNCGAKMDGGKKDG